MNQNQLSNEEREAIAAARREYMRQWRAKNRDKLNAQRAAYREKNRERLREYDRQWRAANPDKVRASYERYWLRKAEMNTSTSEGTTT